MAVLTRQRKSPLTVKAVEAEGFLRRLRQDRRVVDGIGQQGHGAPILILIPLLLATQDRV